MSDIFSLQFAPMEQSISSLNNDAYLLEDQLHKVRNIKADVDMSGFAGSFYAEFQAKYDYLVGDMQKLHTEVAEMATDLQTVLTQARELDEDARLRLGDYTGFNAYLEKQWGLTPSQLHSAKAQPAFSEARLRWTCRADSDGQWIGDPATAQAIVINGIQTDLDSFQQDLMRNVATELEIKPGNLLGVYNRTDNFFSDSYQTLSDKFSAWTGVRLGDDNPAVQSLVDAIKETNGEVPIYAHSQGGAITAAALWQLHHDGYDLSNLKVVTMGSAEFHFPDGPNYEHRINTKDFVPMVVGGHVSLVGITPVINPLSLTKTLLSGGHFTTTPNWFEHGSDYYTSPNARRGD